MAFCDKKCSRPTCHRVAQALYGAQHGRMQRRRRESYGWRRLAGSGRVVGSREGVSSSTSTASGLEAVASSANLGGSGHCEWPSAVSGRATRGGERRNTAASGRIRAVRLKWSLGPVRARWARFPGARALGGRRLVVGSVTRRRGGSSAHRRPSGRDPRTGVTLQRAIGPSSRAGGLMPRRG